MKENIYITTCPFTEPLAEVNLRFGSLQWNDSLNDPESEEFKELAARVQEFVSNCSLCWLL